MVQEDDSLALIGGVCRRRLSRPIDPSSILNPNKAVMTLDSQGKILTANDTTTLFFGEEILNEHSTIFDLMIYKSEIASVKENFIKGRLSNNSLNQEDFNREPDIPVAAEEDIVGSGDIVVFSGNVVVVVTDMGEVPVSLWIRELPLKSHEEPRWIAVIEPIDFITTRILIDNHGIILKTDEKFKIIFDVEAVTGGDNLYDYISVSKSCEGGVKEEYVNYPCTAKLKDGVTFPICVTKILHNKDDDDDDDSSLLSKENQLYDIKIRLFSNISGIIVLDDEFIIQQYNHNFTRLLFGYGSTELKNQKITCIIPEFEEFCSKIIESFNKGHLKDRKESKGHLGLGYENSKDSTIPYMDESVKENEMVVKRDLTSRGKTMESDINANLESSTFGTPNKGFVMSESQFTLSSSNNQKTVGSTTSSPFNQMNMKESVETSSTLGHSAQQTFNSMSPSQVIRDITNSVNGLNFSEHPEQTRFPLDLGLITSTPTVSKVTAEENHSIEVDQGPHVTIGRHKDGSTFSVIFEIRHLVLNEKNRYCLWVSWTLDESVSAMEDESFQRPISNSSNFSTTQKSFSLAEESDYSPCKTSGAVKDSSSSHFKNKRKFYSSLESDDDDTTQSVTGTDGSSGDEYSLSRSDGAVQFKNLRTLSDGDMVLHRENIHLVVTKFINKAKIHKSSLVTDKKTGKKIPVEIDLLMKLDHPNIVKALDYYENDLYYQLVMEKWGSGMDLFDFIDRRPSLDDNLASYIFRQIVSGLMYLQSVNVIHRDIKDENIIINQNFHIKLIDFGSASKFKEGKLFHQFAGTIEYCSPEVLSGKKEYNGHELEVWSLGVTLYTIIHGQNPFGTVNQVISAPLKINHHITGHLRDLLAGMLNKDTSKRFNLKRIYSHPWTNLEIDISEYSFEEIVPCENSELQPQVYITDYNLLEESLSTTSSSFVYEEGQSLKSELSMQKSNSVFVGLPVPCDKVESKRSDEITVSSRTCSSSYKSSVTIDSSVFMTSNKNFKSASSSTFSENTTEESVNAHSHVLKLKDSNHHQSHSRSTGSQASLTSLSSRSEDDINGSLCQTEASGDFDTDEVDGTVESLSEELGEEEEEEETSSSSSDTSTSSSFNSSSTSTSGSFLTQDTVSQESLSEGTLGNTYSNAFALDREGEESGEEF
ncbi:PAS domain-containing serine/threonine-protein kinase [Armadillidium nasatum]|uniref:PAS domain-containing serine/threonine-protein kinase n=1 Tax=Armadillidium nasatum TaxID=96803 RepID=A0A5N5TIK7_9CRUS|nr:PAS domain-containing serine/threonine-protein kinase [Armadillidium nasatum]